MIRRVTLCLIAILAYAGGSAVAATASPVATSGAVAVTLPATEAGRLAADYLRAFNADDAAMREFLTRHISAERLKQRPMEERMSRAREIKSDLRSLTLERVLESRVDHITLLARNGAGEWIELGLDCEPGGMLAGIRIDQAQAPGGSGGARGGAEREGGERAGEGEPDQPIAPGDLPRAIGEAVDAAARGDHFSGVVLVARDGKPIVERASGLAERRFGVPIKPDTRFNLGSINKIFTKVAIGQLVEQGKLAFDDPIGKYLDDFPPEIAKRVTVDQLLSMTSGLGDFFGPEYDAMDKSRLRTLRDYLPLFVHKPLEFEPGAQRRYSNAGYVTLGLIIERVTGADYGDWVRDHVWKPAGMENTALLDSDRPESNVAMGYTRGGHGRRAGPPGNRAQDEPPAGPRVENIYSRPGRGSSAGGGYSTAGDLLRFVNALAANQLLSPAYTRWMFGDAKPVKGAAAAAATGVKGGAIGIAGGAPGINAALEADLGSGYTIIVLSNDDPPSAEDLARRIRRMVVSAAGVTAR